MRKFDCLESCGGKCCNVDWLGGSGWIFLTPKDRLSLSVFLGVKDSEFSDVADFEYTRFSKSKVRASFIKMNQGACMFFKNGKCSVYEARPTQCRTFPFWPEHESQDAWERIATICPGIDKGSECGDEMFNKQRMADLECNRLK